MRLLGLIPSVDEGQWATYNARLKVGMAPLRAGPLF